MSIRRISFQSIPVDDQDRALAFYTENLGLEVHTDAPFGENWRWIFLTIPDAETRLHFAERKDMEIHDKPALALACDDVDELCAKLAASDRREYYQPAARRTLGPWRQVGHHPRHRRQRHLIGIT